MKRIGAFFLASTLSACVIDPSPIASVEFTGRVFLQPSLDPDLPRLPCSGVDWFHNDE